MTDLVLQATKTTVQAIGRAMASLVVLELHLWLNLTEFKDAVWHHCGRLHGALHCGPEVIAGYTSVPAKKSQPLHCPQSLKKIAL